MNSAANNINQGYNQFSLPQEAHAYIRRITERCIDLINTGIWSGIHVQRLRQWLSNFKTEQEKYFAACILDNLIYRSEDQTIALLKQLFQRTLPDLTRLNVSPVGAIYDWEERLKKLPTSYPVNPEIRLVAATKRQDPPTKSAHQIARLIKRFLYIDERWIINSWEVIENIRRNIKIFIFIDDFLGTGAQFEELINDEQLNHVLSEAYFAYLPLTAHVQGIKYLKRTFPRLHVSATEVLDETHGVFHTKSACFKDGINSPQIAKEFYYNLLDKYKITIPGPIRRGFGHFELAYIFQHAAPDNSLPILWWNDPGRWHSLFDR